MWLEKQIFYLLLATKAYPKMQDSTGDPLHLDKRQRHSRQHDTPPPSDGGTWEQFHNQVKTKQQIAQGPKV